MPTEPMALDARDLSDSGLRDCGEVCNDEGTEVSLKILECPGLLADDDSGECS